MATKISLIPSSNCAFLPDQQSKTERYSIYYHVRQRKASNPHIWGAGTSRWFGFWLEKWQLVNKLLHCPLLTFLSLGPEHFPCFLNVSNTFSEDESKRRQSSHHHGPSLGTEKQIVRAHDSHSDKLFVLESVALFRCWWFLTLLQPLETEIAPMCWNGTVKSFRQTKVCSL